MVGTCPGRVVVQVSPSQIRGELAGFVVPPKPDATSLLPMAERAPCRECSFINFLWPDVPIDGQGQITMSFVIYDRDPVILSPLFGCGQIRPASRKLGSCSSRLS